MFLVEMFERKTTMPTAAEALAGRGEPVETAATHLVSKIPLKPPFPAGFETAYFAMGRFTAAEKLFWPLPGVHVTAAGYAGGFTPNPTLQEVLSSLTGHAQTVMVVFDPERISYGALLKLFFERHDPTQSMRQGNDIGTFFRSALFTSNEQQLTRAHAAKQAYQAALKQAGHTGTVVTEIAPIAAFYYAEASHQQHAARNPGAPAATRGTGVQFPEPV
ncbi:peptide-methionine (S)-S-oxide reductase [Hoeflea halophila]|uniref:Peptide methionine sulfoxide reductase MsrA n=1 Tax=Hoeflea halophila TaxID=714899 RepID=A0A286IAQ2_9HYPH|nr:peptide-methionine (S)-S-oxide reductase MsrA [Hoeflea halophila]SOE17170.1 peptide-methionine (S)-S-oxide reductase [Hoeflea halophila]